MSIPLVRNNTRDAINTSIIAIKKNLERINYLLGLMDSNEPDLSGLATKQELEDAVTEINNTIDEVETSLQPVDTVTSGDMHSVTSNAVANVIKNYNKTVVSFFDEYMAQEINTEFSACANYSIFYFGSTAGKEFGCYGFKHNNTKGGVCIVMSVYYGVMIGSGAGLPSTWDYKYIITP